MTCDFQVCIPGDLLVSSERKKAVTRTRLRPVPVTRKVNVHPVIDGDARWCIYPDAEFFEVCERSSVMAANGPLRVFWYFYRKKYPDRTYEMFREHDIYYDITRMIKNMYLTHRPDVARCRHLTFTTDTGVKKYISLEVLRKHLLSVRKEPKNKHKLLILQSKHPETYNGITLQSFTYHMWRLKNTRKLKNKPRSVTKRFRVSDMNQCTSFLRTTKLSSFMDWWPLVESEVAGTTVCAKGLWRRYMTHLAQKKLDRDPWSFRRFLYCVRCVCGDQTSHEGKCVESCEGQCCYGVSSVVTTASV